MIVIIIVIFEIAGKIKTAGAHQATPLPAAVVCQS
jgi:hypothetical protein